MIALIALRWVIGILPALIASVRKHPRRRWPILITFLSRAWSSKGWVLWLVAYILGLIGGVPFAQLNQTVVLPEVWMPIAWSAIIWLIAMIWATRKLSQFPYKGRLVEITTNLAKNKHYIWIESNQHRHYVGYKRSEQDAIESAKRLIDLKLTE
jgi:hypothetical protein